MQIFICTEFFKFTECLISIKTKLRCSNTDLPEEICFERWHQSLHWHCQHQYFSSIVSKAWERWREVLAWITLDWKVTHIFFRAKFTFCRNMCEDLVPPLQYLLWGLQASLEGIPPGTLSQTHLGSDTVALNETRHLCLGLAYQSQIWTHGLCGEPM